MLCFTVGPIMFAPAPVGLKVVCGIMLAYDIVGIVWQIQAYKAFAAKYDQMMGGSQQSFLAQDQQHERGGYGRQDGAEGYNGNSSALRGPGPAGGSQPPQGGGAFSMFSSGSNRQGGYQAF